MNIGPILLLGVVVLGIIIIARFSGINFYRRQCETEFAPGRRMRVTRDVTRAECPWLRRDVAAGTRLVEYLGFTYGVISANGTAVSFDGGVPFFELPTEVLVDAPESYEGSNEARDKLQAALNYDGPHHEMNLPPDYLMACRQWRAALSATDQAIAKVVRATFEKGDDTGALKAAAGLSAAPAYPLI